MFSIAIVIAVGGMVATVWWRASRIALDAATHLAPPVVTLMVTDPLTDTDSIWCTFASYALAREARENLRRLYLHTRVFWIQSDGRPMPHVATPVTVTPHLSMLPYDTRMWRLVDNRGNMLGQYADPEEGRQKLLDLSAEHRIAFLLPPMRSSPWQ